MICSRYTPFIGTWARSSSDPRGVVGCEWVSTERVGDALMARNSPAGFNIGVLVDEFWGDKVGVIVMILIPVLWVRAHVVARLGIFLVVREGLGAGM